MMTVTLPTTRPGAAGHLSLDLPLSAWAQWRDVLVATREAGSVPVDAVVLGPTGVHVVVRSTAAAGSTPVETVLQVVEAVADVLPDRYRGAVAGALAVDAPVDAEDEAQSVGEVVGGVVVATPAVLTDSIRLRPRVLSRSETGLLTAVLDRALVTPAPAVVRPGLWDRLRRRSVDRAA